MHVFAQDMNRAFKLIEGLATAPHPLFSFRCDHRPP